MNNQLKFYEYKDPFDETIKETKNHIAILGNNQVFYEAREKDYYDSKITELSDDYFDSKFPRSKLGKGKSWDAKPDYFDEFEKDFSSSNFSKNKNNYHYGRPVGDDWSKPRIFKSKKEYLPGIIDKAYSRHSQVTE